MDGKSDLRLCCSQSFYPLHRTKGFPIGIEARELVRGRGGAWTTTNKQFIGISAHVAMMSLNQKFVAIGVLVVLNLITIVVGVTVAGLLGLILAGFFLALSIKLGMRVLQL